jgi:hypothetical protein
MRKKAALVIVLVSLAAFIPMIQVEAKTKGYWEHYQYNSTIGVGQGYYHQYKHEGALAAYASIISSTGEYSFTYEWDEPWLFVWIVNEDTHSITVTWREYFYVN